MGIVEKEIRFLNLISNPELGFAYLLSKGILTNKDKNNYNRGYYEN